MQSHQKYHDVKFFLIAIAFISAFNYYLTYSNIRFNSFLLLTYMIDTVQGWIAWWAVRSIIIFLDKKWPYGDQPIRRILVQLVITTFVGLTIIILLTELVSLIAKGKALPLDFYRFDVLIIMIWFIVINGIYIGMHYYNEWRQSEQQRLEDKKLRAGGFTVRQGNQQILVPFGDIRGFYVENGYSILLANDNRKYFPDRSLDKIEEMLPEELFFRLNRQYLLHRSAMTGFKRKGDGKIDVLVKDSDLLPEVIAVSRTKAVHFKSWFQPQEAS